MSIIDDDAVLILGAGVSAPFHFPLGGSLIEEIGRQLAKERSETQGKNLHIGGNWNRFYESTATTAHGFNDFPISGAIASQYILADGHGFQGKELGEDIKRLHDLEKLLENQTSETIDDFIVENPEFAGVTKIAIAAQLFLSSYHYDNNAEQFVSLPFEQRHVWNSDERNWVHWPA